MNHERNEHVLHYRQLMVVERHVEFGTVPYEHARTNQNTQQREHATRFIAVIFSRPPRHDFHEISLHHNNMIPLLLLLLLTTVITADRVYVHPRACETVRHIRLSVGPEPSETTRIVSFASRFSQNTTHIPKGVVYLGTSPLTLETRIVQQEENTHYSLKNIGAKTGNFGNDYYSPYYHHIVLEDLQPNTVYYYKVGLVEDEIEESDNARRRKLVRWPPYNPDGKPCPDALKIHSFRTGSFDKETPLTLALVGDLGQFPHSEDTVARMARDADILDVAILAGDVAYTEFDHRRWDTFLDFFDDYPLFSKVPLQLCPGNHDIDKVAGRHEIFLGYEHRFRMPRVKPAELGVYDGDDTLLNMDAPPYPLPYEWGNAYYSFSYGMAKIIMISAYSSMEPGSTQYTWIQDELQTVDRSKTPWVIAVIHVPLYNTFSLHHHDLQIVAAKEHLEPLFVEYSVNLVFSGHIHAYQRSTNVAFGNITATGPVHITIGAGGRKCEAPYQNETPEDWLEFRDATLYGYGQLELVDRHTAVWQWIPTGNTDGERHGNPIGKSEVTVPPMAFDDTVTIQNQHFL